MGLAEREGTLRPYRIPDCETAFIRELRVKVVRATGVVASDIEGSSDPYAVVTIDGVRQQTSHKPQTLSPVWNEELIFYQVHERKSIVVGIFDYDVVGKHAKIGWGEAVVGRQENGTTRKMAIELQVPPQEGVARPCKIYLELTYSKELPGGTLLNRPRFLSEKEESDALSVFCQMTCKEETEEGEVIEFQQVELAPALERIGLDPGLVPPEVFEKWAGKPIPYPELLLIIDNAKEVSYVPDDPELLHCWEEVGGQPEGMGTICSEQLEEWVAKTYGLEVKNEMMDMVKHSGSLDLGRLPPVGNSKGSSHTSYNFEDISFDMFCSIITSKPMQKRSMRAREQSLHPGPASTNGTDSYDEDSVFSPEEWASTDPEKYYRFITSPLFEHKSDVTRRIRQKPIVPRSPYRNSVVQAEPRRPKKKKKPPQRSSTVSPSALVPLSMSHSASAHRLPALTPSPLASRNGSQHFASFARSSGSPKHHTPTLEQQLEAFRPSTVESVQSVGATRAEAEFMAFSAQLFQLPEGMEDEDDPLEEESKEEPEPPPEPEPEPEPVEILPPPPEDPPATGSPPSTVRSSRSNTTGRESVRSGKWNSYPNARAKREKVVSALHEAGLAPKPSPNVRSLLRNYPPR